MALRQGAYKKTFFDQTTTAVLAKQTWPKIALDLELRHDLKITDAEFCARYILHYLKLSRPKLWLGGNHQDDRLQQLKMNSEEIQLFSEKSMRAIPLAVNRSLVFWHLQQYQLKLYFHVPSPYEVLQMQSLGLRCVTAVLDQDLFQWVKGERDPLSFLIHDLIHADHFYLDLENQKAQIGLYQLLLKIWDSGILQNDFKNARFRTEFEYVASDMNSNAIHMLKYLKAIFIHAGAEQKMQEMLTLWPESRNMQNSFANLNTASENIKTRQILFQYLQNIFENNKKGPVHDIPDSVQRNSLDPTLCLHVHPASVVGPTHTS